MAPLLDAAATVLPTVWVGSAGAVVLRALERSDDAMLAEFVRGLSPASRRERFHAGVPELPAPWLRALLRVDAAREFALIALAREGDRSVCIAEARYALDRERDDTREFALVVADRWHRQGLGAELLQRLLAHAHTHGVERLVGDVQRSNAAMVQLATRAGFRVATHPEDARLLRVERQLAPDRAAETSAPRAWRAAA